jgi:chemosensory pili system protein ChpC
MNETPRDIRGLLISVVGGRVLLPNANVSEIITAATPERDGALNAKVVVLKALGSQPRMPYIALLCLGFPRLTTVSPEILVPTSEHGEGRSGVRMGVLVRDDPAWIPDLPAIEALTAEALGHTAAA